MPRVLIFVFAVLAAAAAATAVFFYRENRLLRAELDAMRTRAEPVESVQTARATVVTPSDPVSTDSLADDSSAPPAAVPPEPPRREPERRGSDRRDRGQEFFARALADPESRAAMLIRAKGQVDRMLGDYFVKLGLSETQIEGLRTLLAERQMARMESGMLERAAENDQERADAQAWRESKLSTTEADINAILGADGLKNLQAYVDSGPQRQVIDDISRRASYLGAPLSGEASDRLLETVQQAAESVPLPDLPGRGGRWNGGNGDGASRQPLTEATVSTYLKDLRTRNQQVIERAREFLTQPQLEALADRQIDEVQQAEAQLNFMMRNPDARGGFGPGRGRGPGG